MKRYWVFAAQRYEEAGGLADLEGRFVTLEEAQECFRKLRKPGGGYFESEVTIVDVLEGYYLGDGVGWEPLP